MHCLISYDITSNKLRLHVSKVLEKYGDRFQFSVFEIRHISVPVYNELLEELKGFKKKFKETDSIFIQKICESCLEKQDVIGKYRKMIIDEKCFVL